MLLPGSSALHVVPLRIGVSAEERAIVLFYTATTNAAEKGLKCRKRVIPIRDLGWLGTAACARSLVEVHHPFLEEVEDQVARQAAQEVPVVLPQEVEEAQVERPVAQVVLAYPYLEVLVDPVEEGQVVQEVVEVRDLEVQEEQAVH